MAVMLSFKFNHSFIHLLQLGSGGVVGPLLAFWCIKARRMGAMGRWNHALGATLWESGTVVSPHWEFRGDGTSDGVAVQLLEGVILKLNIPTQCT